MRICLTCVEIFAWGKFGGFGRSTRLIGRELVKRGVQVTAVVPRRAGQRPQEELDGMRVLGFHPFNPLEAVSCFRAADADIYHVFEPSLGAWLAQVAAPQRKHIVTFIDPRGARDWRIDFRLPSLSQAQVIGNWLYEDNPLARLAARQAHTRYVAAHFLAPLAQAKYRLPVEPSFLPTPVAIPQAVQKAAQPTACYVGRLDRRKRPELYFELARRFPKVRFLAAGKSRDPAYERHLRQAFTGLPNLHLLGFIDQFQSDGLQQVLGQSWVLVNTSAREGLPTAFLEGCAHGCALLSAVDPDGFASQFGVQAAQEDFARGLQYLLEDKRWRELGERGREYVAKVFAIEPVIERYLAEYQRLLDN
jgi:glycosyltransferase involved in cell wall biosynthesis